MKQYLLITKLSTYVSRIILLLLLLHFERSEEAVNFTIIFIFISKK